MQREIHSKRGNYFLVEEQDPIQKKLFQWRKKKNVQLNYTRAIQLYKLGKTSEMVAEISTLWRSIGTIGRR